MIQMPPHTFRQVPSDHPFCYNNPRHFNCVNQRCVFNGALTIGVLSQETLQFLSDTSIPMAFGCSHVNENFIFRHSGTIGGILRLDMAPVSLVNQLDRLINHIFSYCFVPLNLATSATSFPRFGNDIVTHGRI